MKLKMAPNSVFAILLRSPWWMSFVVALAIAAAALALLPERLAPFGIMGAIPFLVVGGIAAARQFRAPSAAQVESRLQAVAAMPWRDFRAVLEQAYQRQGYSVQQLSGGAADLELAKAGKRSLVACKRWKAAVHGTEPLRALSELREAQDASHGVYLTIADVGQATRRFAAGQKIDLLHGAALAQLLGDLPQRAKR